MIELFSALFLLRQHGNTIFAEDAGLAGFCIREAHLSLRQNMRAFLFRELTGRILYRFRGEVTLGSHQTRGGANVPFVWSSRAGQIGISIDAESNPGEKALGKESFVYRSQT